MSVHTFPTGQGNVIGNPIVPVIKITGNPQHGAHHAEHIDVDVSGILRRDMTIPQAGDALIEMMVRTANGRADRRRGARPPRVRHDQALSQRLKRARMLDLRCAGNSQRAGHARGAGAGAGGGRRGGGTRLAPVLSPVLPIPAMVSRFVHRHCDQSGCRPARVPTRHSVLRKDLLRWAVALLGLRIALGDIVALGWLRRSSSSSPWLATIASGFLFARAFGQTAPYGALAGAGTAVCGASATLATATVLPAYRGKEADVVFVVVAVNALSTAAMVLYPLALRLAGLGHERHRRDARRHHPRRGAGRRRRLFGFGKRRQYRRHRQTLPRFPADAGGARDRLVVRPRGCGDGTSQVPVPVFAFVFLALCLVNSIAEAPAWPSLWAGASRCWSKLRPGAC